MCLLILFLIYILGVIVATIAVAYANSVYHDDAPLSVAAISWYYVCFFIVMVIYKTIESSNIKNPFRILYDYCFIKFRK